VLCLFESFFVCFIVYFIVCAAFVRIKLMMMMMIIIIIIIINSSIFCTLVAVSGSRWAMKLCSNEILRFLTGDVTKLEAQISPRERALVVVYFASTIGGYAFSALTLLAGWQEEHPRPVKS